MVTAPLELKATSITDEKGREKEICLGNRIKLVPAGFKKYANEKDRCFGEAYIESIKREIGTRPRTILRIVKWPSGKVMLYLDVGSQKGRGYYADYFMAVE